MTYCNSSSSQVTIVLATFFLFVNLPCFGQDCLDVDVPDDLIICESQDVDLIGSITGDYFAFEWNGTNGFFDDQNLISSDFVSTTTTYTLSASQFGTVNLVTNGDFESGNTGFTSDYDFNPNTNVGGLGQGDYNLDVVYPSNWSGANCPSINGSTMMVVNAAVVPNVNIYCTDVTITPNTEYVFTVDILTLNNPPPILQFSINGVLLGNVFNGGPQCVVDQFYQVWDSGPNTSATICIVNQSTAAGGNDFAMDDVSFTEVCKGEAEFTVTVEEFDVNIDDPSDISCNNEVVDLFANATPDLGQQYEWSTSDGNIIGGINTPSISVDVSGNYTVIVTSANGCTQEADVEVFGDADIPTFDIIGVQDLNCANATFFIEADLNDPNLNYTWTLPNGNESNDVFIEVSAPGIYTLTVVDPSNDCSHTEFVDIVSVGWVPSVSSFVDGQLDCSNDNVDVSFQISEIFDVLTIVSPTNLITNTTDLIFSASEPGQYVFSFVYGNCSYTDVFEVDESSDFDFLISNTVDTLLCSQQNATISVIVTGDFDSITWYSDGEVISSDSMIVVSEPGTYVTEVMNSLGCIGVDSITIYEDMVVPTIQFEIDTISCLEPNGGFNVIATTADSLLWIGNNDSSTSLNPSFNVGGDYTLILFSENGCNDTLNTLLPVSEDYPEITSDIANIDCGSPEGAINLTSNLEADFDWTGPGSFTSNEDSIEVSVGGFYYLNVTTVEGCVLLDTFEISIDTTKPNLIVVFDSLTCDQTSIIPQVSSDSLASISWVFPDNTTSDENSPVLSLPGSYIVIAQASNGCDTAITVNLESYTESSGFNVAYGLLTCDNPNTYLVVDNPDLSYTLLDGAIETEFTDSIAISGAGTFMINGTNQYGCDSIITVVVEIDEELPEFDIDYGLLICNDTTTFIVVDNPNLTYSLNDGSLDTDFKDSIAVVGAGIYMVTGTNQSGCDSTIVVELQVSEELPEFDIDYGLLICNDTTTYIVVDNPNLTYSLNDGSLDTDFKDSIAVVGAGTYMVTGTNQSGCDSTIIVQLQVSEELPDFGVTHGSLTCAITSTTIVVDNTELTYILFDGSQETEFTDSITVAGTGMYLVTGNNEWGCSLSTSIEITEEIEYPSISLEANELNCQVIISMINNLNPALSDIEYLWTGQGVSSNESFIEVSAEGWYFLEVTNDLGCSSLDSIFVSGNFDVPDLEIVGDSLLECHEESEVLSLVSSLASYKSTWTDVSGNVYDENEITVTEEGLYIASIQNLENGCITFDSIEIQSLKGPSLDFGLILPDCPGDFGSLGEVSISGGQVPYTVFLDNENLGINSALDAVGIPDYIVHQLTIVDNNGCEKDTFFMIEAVAEIQLDLSIDISTEGTQIISDISVDSIFIDEISWSPSATLSCTDCLFPFASPSETTDYTVSIITVDGCIIESSIRVTVEPQNGVSIPNVFSPNGDGGNDYFTVYEKFESVKLVEVLSIYDRWGNLVYDQENFEPNIPELGWDGTFNGAEVTNGVYVYFVTVVYNSDEKESISGTITVVR